MLRCVEPKRLKNILKKLKITQAKNIYNKLLTNALFIVCNDSLDVGLLIMFIAVNRLIETEL